MVKKNYTWKLESDVVDKLHPVTGKLLELCREILGSTDLKNELLT